MKCEKDNIPVDMVAGLQEVIGYEPASIANFEFTEKMACTYALTNDQLKAEYCQLQLNTYWDTPVQVFTMRDDESVFVYVTFNYTEGHFFIGEYPDVAIGPEASLSSEVIEELHQLRAEWQAWLLKRCTKGFSKKVFDDLGVEPVK